MTLTGLPEKIYISAYNDWKTSHQIQQEIYKYREKKVTEYLKQYSEKGYFEHINKKWRSTTKGLIEKISKYITLNEQEIKIIEPHLNDKTFRNMIKYNKDKNPNLIKILNIIQITAFQVDKFQTNGIINNIKPDKKKTEQVKKKFNEQLKTNKLEQIDWNNISMEFLVWTHQLFHIKPIIIKKLTKLPQYEKSQDIIHIARGSYP